MGVQASGTCLLGTSKGHLGGGEIRRSDWQEKREGISSKRSNTPPPKAFYWNHLGGDELTTEALGTSKLAAKKGSGEQGASAGCLGVRSEPRMLTFYRVHLGVMATPGILRIHHMGKTRPGTQLGSFGQNRFQLAQGCQLRRQLEAKL